MSPITSRPAPRDRRQRVQAAATGIAILKGLAALGGRASLSQLARRIDESPAKVHRYLGSMADANFVIQDAATQEYALGPEVIHLGLAAMRVADPLRLAEAPLNRLCHSLELTAFLSVMGNYGPTIVRFEEPGLPVTVNVRVGSVLSVLNSATGRVFLAFEGDGALRALARKEHQQSARATQSNHEFEPLAAQIEKEVRTHGVAVVRNLYLPGISAIAAPIYNAVGKVVAVVTVLGSTGSFAADPHGEVANALRAEAAVVSRALGNRASNEEG